MFWNVLNYLFFIFDTIIYKRFCLVLKMFFSILCINGFFFTEEKYLFWSIPLSYIISYNCTRTVIDEIQLLLSLTRTTAALANKIMESFFTTNTIATTATCTPAFCIALGDYLASTTQQIRCQRGYDCDRSSELLQWSRYF